MREFVLLDSGLLGYACKRPGTPWADRYRNWVDGLLARGVDIVLPEISDYEVRRELLRIQAFASLQRLDELIETGNLLYLPIRTPAWREAAQLWADARNRGRPTASSDALDADVILAACAVTIGRPGDQVIVATMNVGHLSRYCDARLWSTIA